MKAAVKKLQANGWYVEEFERGMKAMKDGQRNIFLRGSIQHNYIDCIAIHVYRGQQQWDVETDVHFCDTVKEAMQAA